MSVTIEIPVEIEATLRQHAARTGQDVNAFVLRAVEEKIAKANTFDEICAPIANAISAAGLPDAEIDEFFNDARNEVWKDKSGK